MLRRRLERLALGSPAHGARDVEPRSGLRSARQHEALELGKIGVEAVAVGLERVDLLLRRTQPPLQLERDGEIGAEIEELVLDAREHVPQLGRGSPRRRPRRATAFSSSTVP